MEKNYGPPKYEISGNTTFVSLDKYEDVKIKYAIANELHELNLIMRTIKLALMNMSQTSSDQFYKRS